MEPSGSIQPTDRDASPDDWNSFARSLPNAVEHRVGMLPHAQRGIEELQALLSSEEFAKGYLEQLTKPERDYLAKIEWRMEGTILAEANRIHAKEAALEILRQRGLAAPGQSAEEYQKSNREIWRRTRKSITHVYYSVDGRRFLLDLTKRKGIDPDLRDHLLSQEPRLEARYRKIESLLDQKAVTGPKLLEKLRSEFSNRKNDPRLLEAMDSWVCTPNPAGDWSPDRRGYHAGVMHYFAYRAYREKAGRFRHDPLESFSIDGFIGYSVHLRSLLKNPAGSNFPFLKLEDAAGNSRSILQVDSLWIVGFQSFDGPSRIVTAYPTRRGRLLNQRDLIVRNELDPVSNRRRFNSLGPGVRLVDSRIL